MTKMICSQYDKASNPTALRGQFICPYCGNEVVRRLSKVKNPNLVFCNNDCRGRWQERERLKRQLFVNDKDFLREIKEQNNIISYVYKEFLGKFANIEYDELQQISWITIWKYYNQAQDETKGKKSNFYIKAIKNAFFNELTRAQKFYPLEDFAYPVNNLSPETICIMKGL